MHNIQDKYKHLNIWKDDIPDFKPYPVVRPLLSSPKDTSGPAYSIHF